MTGRCAFPASWLGCVRLVVVDFLHHRCGLVFPSVVPAKSVVDLSLCYTFFHNAAYQCDFSESLFRKRNPQGKNEQESMRSRFLQKKGQNPPNPLSIFANPLREDPKKTQNPDLKGSSEHLPLGSGRPAWRSGSRCRPPCAGCSTGGSSCFKKPLTQWVLGFFRVIP